MSTTKASTSYQKGKIYNLSVDDIKVDLNQPRQVFDEQAHKELTISVKRNGIIQPIIFRQEDDQIFLISGERRLRAAKDAGLKNIPGIYNTGDPNEIALVENILRLDLNPIDEAEALQRLKSNKNYKNEDLGEIIGKSYNTISEILSLNKLPDKVKEECRKNSRYSRRELKKISSKKNEKTMSSEFKKYKDRLDKKEANNGKKAPNREKIVILNETIKNLLETIKKLNNKLSDTEKEAYKVELRKLRDNINELIGTE